MLKEDLHTMSHNPFEAPATMEAYTSDTSVGGLPLASQGQRFANYFVEPSHELGQGRNGKTAISISAGAGE